MGKGAGGDEVGAGLRVGAESFQPDATRNLHHSSAPDAPDRFGRFGDREIIQENVSGSASKGFFQFAGGPHFDFDRQAAGRAEGSRALDRRFYAASRGDVIVLDQYAVEEAETVIGRAARSDRELLQTAHAGRGFPGVEHAAAGSFHNFRETPARVATPLSRCKKLRAVRSAVNRARRGPCTSAAASPSRISSPLLRSSRMRAVPPASS